MILFPSAFAVLEMEVGWQEVLWSDTTEWWAGALCISLAWQPLPSALWGRQSLLGWWPTVPSPQLTARAMNDGTGSDLL